jgi:hypothetical protein
MKASVQKITFECRTQYSKKKKKDKLNTIFNLSQLTILKLKKFTHCGVSPEFFIPNLDMLFIMPYLRIDKKTPYVEMTFVRL